MSGQASIEELKDLPRAVLHHIFDFLGPRDLCVSSAVCRRWRDLNHDPTSKQKWRVPAEQKLRTATCWQSLYNSKMLERWSFGGKPTTDILQGHADAVRCLGLLSSCNLLASGRDSSSRDRYVRLWDLKAGMLLATTRSPVGSVRSLTLDEDLLVVGGTDPDYKMCVWRPYERVQYPNEGCHFDMQRPVRLRGHSGPISALALDQTLIYSGSWDYTVRLWTRGSQQQAPDCISVLSFDDWVWSVCPRGSLLMVAAGCSAFVHDKDSGRLLHAYREDASCRPQLGARVDGTRDGRFLFASTRAGCLLAYDLRSSSSAPAAVLWEHKAEVRALAFEDPWLTAALADGTLALLDVEAAMRARRSSSQRAQAAPGAAARIFALPSFSPHCVDISGQWLAAGEQNGLVRTWDFTSTKTARQPAATATNPARMTRKQRKAATRAIKEAADHAAEPGDAQLSPASREQAIAAARQSLLQSLLAEEQAELAADVQDAAPGHECDTATCSDAHRDVACEMGRRESGMSDTQHNSGDSDLDQGAIAQAGVGNAGDVAGHDEDLGPMRRTRERRQGRRGRGKSAGPHSGAVPGRRGTMPSPPLLAASGRSSSEHAHRSASSMATWRIVKPNRALSGGQGK